MIWFLPLLIPTVGELIGISVTAVIIDKYLENKTLKEKVRILPSLIKLMYSAANIDGITEEESSLILKYIDDNLKEFENKKLEEKKLSDLKKDLNRINLDRNNIQLSDALKAFKETGLKFDELFSLIEDVINADNKITFEEKLILKRLKIYNEAKDKNEAINQIEEDEKPFLEHYKYVPNSNIKKLKNNLIIINDDYEKFENIKDLSENEYYIPHPKNSKLLYSINKLNNIKDNTIEEFTDIAALLGALEVSYSIERVQDNKANVNINAKVKASDTFNEAEFTAKNTSNLSNSNEYHYSHTKKLTTGIKEERSIVEKRILWTRGDNKTKALIESIYSKNPLKEWKEDFYLKTIVNSLDKTLLNGALRIATAYEINIDVDIEKQYQSMKEEKISIYIKFEND